MAKNDIQVTRSNERAPLAENPFYDMNRLMDRFFVDPFGAMLSDVPSVSLRADVKETNDSYLLSAEIPGIPKDEVEINVNGNILTIHAEHKEEEGSEASSRGYRREYRSFHQSFTLPSTVDSSAIEAQCDNGMLEVLLPKAASSQAKKVEIQSGKGGLWSRLAGKKNVGQDVAKKEKH